MVGTPPPLAFADPVNHVIVVPEVPANLEVEAGNKVYLAGHGVGTQNYICMACPNAITPAAKCPASGFAWAFFGPQATLFEVNESDGEQIMTHFNSPNPVEAGQERPTWQHSRETSTVWANNTFPPAQSSNRGGIRPAGRDSVAAPAVRGNSGRTDGWRQADRNDLHPAPEYRRRRRAGPRYVCRASGRREEGVGAL